ncbi:AAA family ATPase [Actinoalloteichus caeruleus]|uniref:AAA family ATPase n=1 Tax=Actinoalloteichus cyanogriseus TaxID=2893586 RepID=UPI003BB8BE89
MLTRIEVDGFKSFADFGLDIPPFLAILGQNASGKSNLFDAIQLLGRLASSPSLYDACTGARGDLSELFRWKGDGTAVNQMRFAVEVLLEPTVVDPFGRQVRVTHTRLRYELEIERRTVEDGSPRLFVVSEEARPIRRKDDDWVRDQRVSREFRDANLAYRRTSALLVTETNSAGDAVFSIRQEGNQGRARQLPAHAAEATVLSSITSTVEFPLLYALRREMESWRFLQLDPVALRSPSTPEQRGDQLEPAGGNLAKVLRRIERETTLDQGSVLDDITVDLARVVRGFSGVEVEENPATGQWEIHLDTSDEGRVSARIASDGTMRVLALLAALHDPKYRGLICFEEPENGIFPQRFRALVQLLRKLVTHPAEADAGEEPLAQLVLSSHSPLVLFVVDPSDIIVMDWVSRVEPGGGSSRVSRARSLDEPSRVSRSRGGGRAGQAELDLGVHPVSRHERRALPGIDREHARQLLEDD